MTLKRKVILSVTILICTLLVFQLLYRWYQTSDIPKNDQAYLSTLDNFSEFLSFAGRPLDSAYANMTSVKAVYDLKRKQLYFVNSHLYRLHFDFCTNVLGYKFGLNIFNLSNYSSQRDYYLANINYLKKSKRFVLEFGPYDEIDSVQIIEMYNHVRRSPLFKNNLQLLLNNTTTLRYFAKQQHVPTCDISVLNDGLSYQMIQTGTCTGRLVVCDDLKARYLSITPNDIIVVKGTPVEVPVCSAIISDCFQTPLSHIQVLSHNKNMPSAYLQHVFRNDSIRKYDGKIVRLVITADTIVITPSTSDRNMNRAVNKIQLKLNTSIRSLIPIEDCDKLTNGEIGTKAKGMSDLNLISKKNKELFQIPEGAFVIPFYFFKEHLKNSKVEQQLIDLQHCAPEQTEKIDSLLRQIRRTIKNTTVSAELLAQVNTQIAKNRCGNSYRFRSSSNAEDLPNFNGAGLYDSKTGQLNNDQKSIEKAIKKVWASVYNYRAYQERCFANIDESTAGMSILVHRNFPQEEINGVVISKNIYRSDYPGIVINAQMGDVSTVSPPDSVVCEQLILSENKLMNPFSKKVAAKYLCFSSLHPEGPLLSYEKLLSLQHSMNAILNYYASRNLNWDIEFKFDNKVLYIKQVRPYR